ncbi:MAG TPA: N-acetyltransferase [Candidatus Acidoferrales bacterium]|nr:N-acetyltransferase [Candidatus Acidoferrales bacterium]
MSISLRNFAPADFETLYEIDQLCYDPAIAYSRRELRDCLRFPGADCLVAETQEQPLLKIAGFIVTARQKIWGHVVTIDVLEAYRRRGVASMMLAEAERRLFAAGVRKVALETATNNDSAIAFWQKHAYRIRGTQKGYYPGGRDALSMSKALEES